MVARIAFNALGIFAGMLLVNLYQRRLPGTKEQRVHRSGISTIFHNGELDG